MLSDSDFHRLMNDPRLGEVERFFEPNLFQPIQLRCPTPPQFVTVSSEKEKEKNATRKSKRCGHCSNCRKKDCGDCIQCLDKPKFGGSGVRKQSCNRRRPCEKFANSDHKQTEVVVVKPAVVKPAASMVTQCFACNGKHRRHTCGAQNTIVSASDLYDAIDTETETSLSPRSSTLPVVLQLSTPVQISTPPAVLEVV